MLKQRFDFIVAEIIVKALLVLSAVSGVVGILALGYLLIAAGIPRTYEGQVDLIVVNNACLLQDATSDLNALKDGQSVTFSVDEDTIAEIGFVNGRLDVYKHAWGTVGKFVDLKGLDQATITAQISGRYGDTVSTTFFYCRGRVFFENPSLHTVERISSHG